MIQVCSLPHIRHQDVGMNVASVSVTSQIQEFQVQTTVVLIMETSLAIIASLNQMLRNVSYV